VDSRLFVHVRVSLVALFVCLHLWYVGGWAKDLLVYMCITCGRMRGHTSVAYLEFSAFYGYVCHVCCGVVFHLFFCMACFMILCYVGKNDSLLCWSYEALLVCIILPQGALVATPKNINNETSPKQTSGQ